jgi:triphosphatase
MNKPPKAVEVELKLLLPDKIAETPIVNLLRQNKYNVQKINPLSNIDTYMDTSDWALMKNKLSLRYRLSNNTAIYTLKSIGPIENGIANRMENEITLEKPAPKPTEITVKPLKQQVKSLIYPRKLLEQIVIRTVRRRYLVDSPEGSKFELDFDKSKFSASALEKPRRGYQYRQLEVEVVDGTASALKDLGKLLSDNFGYPPATSTKLQSAMTSLKVQPLVKKVPKKFIVNLDDRLDAALKKILSIEFHWFQQQLPGVISDRDPEFVHQARVATRRMRSALILFHNSLPEPTAGYFEERLKWLGGLFGEVRDLDVFIINLNGYKDKLESFPKAEKKALEGVVIKRRRIPLKALKEALKSRRYQNFERRLKQFLESPCVDCPELPQGMKKISEVAPSSIGTKFENVVEQGHKVSIKSELPEFHCLRIQAKRLRYALEFMAPAYGSSLNDVILQTVRLQDNLGELQDTVFNQKLIKRILKDFKGKLLDDRLIFVLGEIYQLQGEIAREHQKTFKDIWIPFSSEQMIISLNKTFKEQPVSGDTKGAT